MLRAVAGRNACAREPDVRSGGSRSRRRPLLPWPALTVGINVITARAGEPAGAAARAAVPAAASLAPATPGSERCAAIQDAAEHQGRQAARRREASQGRGAPPGRGSGCGRTGGPPAGQSRRDAHDVQRRRRAASPGRSPRRSTAGARASSRCLNSLWAKESGWNYQAANPSSGAYGIPQALPGSKMATSAATGAPTRPRRSVGAGLHRRPLRQAVLARGAPPSPRAGTDHHPVSTSSTTLGG